MQFFVLDTLKVSFSTLSFCLLSPLPRLSVSGSLSFLYHAFCLSSMPYILILCHLKCCLYFAVSETVSNLKGTWNMYIVYATCQQN